MRARVPAAHDEPVAAGEHPDAFPSSLVVGDQLKPSRGWKLFLSVFGHRRQRKQGCCRWRLRMRSFRSIRLWMLLPGSS